MKEIQKLYSEILILQNRNLHMKDLHFLLNKIVCPYLLESVKFNDHQYRIQFKKRLFEMTDLEHNVGY